MAMTERESPAQRSRRGGARKRTPAAVQAGKDNLAKGRAKRAEVRKAAGDRDTAAVRWSKLLSGEITVKDLDDEEIEKRNVKGKDGCINGTRAVPSHIGAAMAKELMSRADGALRKNLIKAVDYLGDVIDDSDAKDSDKIKAADMIINRLMGKPDQRLVIQDETKFEAMAREAAGVVVDREMADLLKEEGGQDGNA
jgi:hypothetical protein